MRIWGAFLLIGGFLLCVSIVWAALGFLMMGFGLICLLIAERRKARLADPTRSRTDEISSPQAPALIAERSDDKSSKASDSAEIDRRQEPLLFPEPNDQRSPGSAAAVRQEKIRSGRGRALLLGPNKAKAARPEQQDSQPDATGYSRDAWLSLARNDADISRAIAALAPFGDKYVDELARAYMVLNDKEYLPIIVRKILTTARSETGRDAAGAASAVARPRADSIKAQALQDAVAGKADLPNKRPSAKSDAKQTQTVAALALRGRTEDGPAASSRDQKDAGRTAPIVAPEAMNDDVQDFADLLNRLDLVAYKTARR